MPVTTTLLVVVIVLVLVVVPTQSTQHHDVGHAVLPRSIIHHANTNNRSLLTTGSMSSVNASSSTMWVGWSFCNQANEPDKYTQALHLPSPRRAICPDVTRHDNDLTFPDPIPGFDNDNTTPATPDEYARAKELYLSRQCNHSTWMVMFKSGNMDRDATQTLCRETEPSHAAPFNDLPMNQPLMVYDTIVVDNNNDNNNNDNIPTSYSYFAGTYDVDVTWTTFQLQQVQAALHHYTQAWMNYYYYDIITTTPHGTAVSKDIPTPPELLQNSSFLYTGWIRTPTQGLLYSSMVRTNLPYPWLMNYLRSNDHDLSINPPGYGGYPWQGAGNVMGPVAATSQYDLVMTVRMLIYARPNHFLFYMPEFSGCWKRSDGSPCDPGDDNLEDNLTRYLCYSVTETAYSPCQPNNPQRCPPWHFSFQLQEWISAYNTTYYPYECYHQYCGPYGDGKLICDPYSNPIPQELVQLKTCKEWGYYGFPTEPLPITNPTGSSEDDENATTWVMNVGALGNVVYFYDAKHNNGTVAPNSSQLPRRSWISFDVGPEVGVGSPRNPAEANTETRWQVSHWDLQLVPVQQDKDNNKDNDDQQHVVVDDDDDDNDDDYTKSKNNNDDDDDNDDGFGAWKTS